MIPVQKQDSTAKDTDFVVRPWNSAAFRLDMVEVRESDV
jgi:hypothetical protein